MKAERADPLLMRALELDAELLARPDEARSLATEVVTAARTARRPEAEIVALRALGWANREVFAYDAAEVVLERARRLARRHGLPLRLADVLVTRGALRLQQGHIRQAERDLAAARGLVGDSPSAELDFLQGRLEEELGRLTEAAASYRRALVPRRLAPPPALRVKILNNAGGIASSLGRFDEAQAMLIEGRAVAAAIGPAPLAYLNHSLGYVALQRGRLPEALKLFDEGDAAVVAAGLPKDEFDLIRLAGLLAMFLPAEAVELADRVVTSQRRPGNELLLAQALLDQAKALLLANSFDEAVGPASQAHDLFVRQRRPAWAALASTASTRARLGTGAVGPADMARVARAARTLEQVGFVNHAIDANLLLGRVALVSGKKPRARAAFERVVTLARHGPVHQRLQGRLAEALMADEARDDAAVRRVADRGLRDLEDYRATLASTELRALASGHGAELASLGVGAALATRRPATVLAWLERARGRSLLGVPARAQSPKIAVALAELRSLVARQTVEEATEPEGLAGLRYEQARLERQILRLDRTADAEGSIAGGVPASTREIQAALGDGALVELAVHDGVVIAVAVTSRRLRLFTLAPIEPVEHEHAFLRASLHRLGRARTGGAGDRARAAAEQALTRMDELLLTPLRRELDGASAAVVVPPARLLGVPWAAMPSLAGRSVVVTPSASLWIAAAHAPPAPTTTASVALIAGPSLRGATEEVEALASLHPTARLLAPPASTVGATLLALDGTHLAHLACHGRFRSDNPTFSALEMADGPLTMHDLEQVDLLPRCLVLAACDSGLSEAHPGEELIGFLARLLAGGTATVIASVVPVPDVDTVPLMLALHRSLKAGASPAAALARARADVVDSSSQGFLAATAFACFGSG